MVPSKGARRGFRGSEACMGTSWGVGGGSQGGRSGWCRQRGQSHVCVSEHMYMRAHKHACVHMYV